MTEKEKKGGKKRIEEGDTSEFQIIKSSTAAVKSIPIISIEELLKAKKKKLDKPFFAPLF